MTRQAMTSRRIFPTKTARVWVLCDAFGRLHWIGQLAVLGVAALLVLFLLQWWTIVLGIATGLIAWRIYLRHVERSRARGTIPYGRLAMTEWLACRLIEAGEKILREHGRRRP
jgi:hypothetical protein